MLTNTPVELAPDIQVPLGDAPASMPEVFGRITDLARRLRQFESRTLRESGLTPPQLFVLGLLFEQDGRPLGRLADISSCTRATMTGVADTLERKGLIRRGPNPDDRRGTLVWLTDEGRTRFETTPELCATFDTCCEPLPVEESRELSRLLAKLADVLPF